MRLVQIRTVKTEDAACLMRELAVYSPTQMRRAVVVQLEERSPTDLVALLGALETCLLANDIRSVRVELDGRPYLMATQ